MIRRLSAAFTDGVVGALVDSVDIWALGELGATGFLGIGLRPQFTGPWLYPRLVGGGIWGFLFLLPILRGRTLVRGLLFSLIPTAYVLTVVFPTMGKSLFGLGFGTLTPLLVLGLNFGWEWWPLIGTVTEPGRRQSDQSSDVGGGRMAGVPAHIESPLFGTRYPAQPRRPRRRGRLLC